MSSAINIGIIGYGGRIRSLIEKLPPDPRLRITAIADPFDGAVELARAAHGPSLKIHSDYRALVADPSIDWVMIGSWNSQHAEHVIAALDAGKHVFCEKPLATTLEDCLAIRDAVNRSGRQFFFGLVLRYSPHYQCVRKLLDEDRIGRLISFEFNETLAFTHGGYIFGNWRRALANSGSFLLEKCCHDLDLANWMTASLPVRVASFGGRSIFTPQNAGLEKAVGPHNGKQGYRQWDDLQGVDPFSPGASVNDHQVAILQYASGAKATFHFNAHAAQLERRFYLLGLKGSIRADAVSTQLEFRPIAHNSHPQQIVVEGAEPNAGHTGADKILMARLADSMLDHRPPLAGITEALHSAISAFGLDQAETTGQVVDLHPLWQKAGIAVADHK